MENTKKGQYLLLETFIGIMDTAVTIISIIVTIISIYESHRIHKQQKSNRHSTKGKIAFC